MKDFEMSRFSRGTRVGKVPMRKWVPIEVVG